MRSDIYLEEVIEKCDVLKKSGLWLPEPSIRPRAWLGNFEAEDKGIASLMLDKFTFYNRNFTDRLLIASYYSIGDGLEKGPQAPTSDELTKSLRSAVYTPVTGEIPNPTDSGYLMCRKARQLLDIPEDLILDPKLALVHASLGKTVVFLDDFIGSGDQFLETWNRKYGRSSPHSFSEIHNRTGFTAIYITLVTTDFGLNNINTAAPNVARLIYSKRNQL